MNEKPNAKENIYKLIYRLRNKATLLLALAGVC